MVSNRPVVEPIQPQLSPGVSTVRIEAAYPEVVERNSPPTPVEILPSNAGQDIAPTQSAEVNECQINPYICGMGICYNTAEGYTCHCDEGYRLDDAQTTCIDVDECLESTSLCFGGRCENTEGSFLCVCSQGFLVNEERNSCFGTYPQLMLPELVSFSHTFLFMHKHTSTHMLYVTRTQHLQQKLM
ncbi:latent-transforming growth factor beta-binding protein 1-like [Anarrhichthys ocellatus]|nr:latent-transforming growth factor beta-binding protein 1-like [Anarrhichthys ocellatus]